MGQHEPRGLPFTSPVCVLCAFMGEVSQGERIIFFSSYLRRLDHDGEEELRALGPDRMSIMVAVELVRHCKAHRELCTQRNIIEHGKTLQKTHQNIIELNKTL